MQLYMHVHCAFIQHLNAYSVLEYSLAVLLNFQAMHRQLKTLKEHYRAENALRYTTIIARVDQDKSVELPYKSL